MKKKLYLLPVLLWLAVPCTYAQNNNSTANNQRTLPDFVYEKPGLKPEGEPVLNKSGLLRFYLITSYREGVKPIQGSMKMRFEIYDNHAIGTRRVAMYNLTIPELLTFFEINPERLIPEVKDPSKYLYKPEYGDQTDWMHKNSFCYELEMPESTFSEATMNEIKADISHAFGVNLKSEKRMSDDKHRYGLKAEEPNREVEVLILTERNQ